MSYTIVKLLAARYHENNLVTYTLAVLFLLHFVIGAQR
jgi:xanthine/uracil/vitamin C permease (AzgA family)